jgi:hypothetical protein
MSQLGDLQNLQIALEAAVIPVGLPPVQRVYLNPTEKIVTTAELPCLLLFWRRQPQISFITFGIEKQQTEYVVQFILTPVGQGTLNDNVVQALQYQIAILDSLYAHLRLNNTVNWQIPKSGGLPGQLPDKWGGQAWFGFDVLVTTVSTRKVTIGV